MYQKPAVLWGEVCTCRPMQLVHASMRDRSTRRLHGTGAVLCFVWQSTQQAAALLRGGMRWHTKRLTTGTARLLLSMPFHALLHLPLKMQSRTAVAITVFGRHVQPAALATTHRAHCQVETLLALQQLCTVQAAPSAVVVGIAARVTRSPEQHFSEQPISAATAMCCPVSCTALPSRLQDRGYATLALVRLQLQGQAEERTSHTFTPKVGCL